MPRGGLKNIEELTGIGFCVLLGIFGFPENSLTTKHQMQIKQNSASLALVFFMKDSTDHVSGKTGLTPTVTLSKNGAAFSSPAGAVSEIANGFYKVAPHATDSNTLGILALTATGSGADRCAMAYEIVANLESDSITAIAALTAPDNAGIAAIKAKTDNLPASPAATGDIPSIPDIIGAAGGLTVETVAALEAANQILLAAPYVPDESPALIIPAPDTDESLTVVYAYTENIINDKRAGIVLTFKLVTAPAKSERLLEVAAQTATTDADGYAQITLQSDLRYRVTCRELGLEKIFTPTGETLNLLTLIP